MKINFFNLIKIKLSRKDMREINSFIETLNYYSKFTDHIRLKEIDKEIKRLDLESIKILNSIPGVKK